MRNSDKGLKQIRWYKLSLAHVLKYKYNFYNIIKNKLETTLRK